MDGSNAAPFPYLPYTHYAHTILTYISYSIYNQGLLKFSPRYVKSIRLIDYVIPH